MIKLKQIIQQSEINTEKIIDSIFQKAASKISPGNSWSYRNYGNGRSYGCYSELSKIKKLFTSQQISMLQSLVGKNNINDINVKFVIQIYVTELKKDNLYEITLKIFMGRNSEMCALSFKHNNENSVISSLGKIFNEVKSTIAKNGNDVLVFNFFNESFQISKYLKTVDKKQSSQRQHIGIGSQSSVKIYHDIRKKYDVRLFCKKYGESKLKQIAGNTYWWKTHVKDFSNGIISTDQSWTDTYD